MVRRSALRACALLLAAVLTGCGDEPPPFRGTALPAVDWGRDFTLTSHTGARLDTAVLRGRVQVLFFGFTHCPDICAPTLVKLAQAKSALGADAARVQVLFITVDPDHDTPQQLAKFVPAFDPTFIGLTGSAGELVAVARDHKVHAEAEGGAIAHTGSVLVKDVNGKLRLIINESASVDDLTHDLRLLLDS
jgi:protein SCO1/2